MHAVRIHEHGGVNVLGWESVPDPTPESHEVVVQTKAGALNHLDIFVRKGFPGIPLPLIPGSDGAGIVTDVGNSVSNFKINDEVIVQPLTYCGKCTHCLKGYENYCDQLGILGESENGTFCEYFCVNEKYLRKKPAHLSFLEAGSFSLVLQTAYMMLVNRAKITNGETVLIWGGSSGVGSMAIQISKIMGCKVIATGSTNAKLEFIRSLGADHAINYNTDNVKNEVKQLTGGKGVDIVFEHVGMQTWNTSLQCLGKGGRLVTCGATTGARVELDLRHLFIKQQSVFGSTMGNLASYEAGLDLIRKGLIKPVIDRSFDMSDIQSAHKYLENNSQFGKVLVIP